MEAAIGFGDPLRLLVQLGEDQRQLIFNLHRHLQTSTEFVSQSVELGFNCRPNQPQIGPMNLVQSTPKWITELCRRGLWLRSRQRTGCSRRTEAGFGGKLGWIETNLIPDVTTEVATSVLYRT
jgi:hypothetical protein